MSDLFYYASMNWLYNYVTFDKIKWLSAFTKYITIKFLTKPQSIYINEFMLTSFSPFDIKCKKLNLKNIQRVSFSYFSKLHSIMGGAFSIPLKIFVGYVTIFNSSPIQHLRWSSLWQKISNVWKPLLTIVT